ncbi:MAG: hypothetical protein SYC29_08470 [Planctomycetota bacterium]|nr:hypothetical protein [Planctomycetota bacterium]
MRGCVFALCAAALAGLATASSQADWLVYNDSIPDGNGWAVWSYDQQPWSFAQFQKFTVTDAAGWEIDSIGIDGWLTYDTGGNGLQGIIVPDVNGMPDEENPIAQATYFLASDPYGSNWRDEAFDIVLDQGEYWFWYFAPGPGYRCAIFNATDGEESFTRNYTEGEDYPHGPLALRIDGTVVPGPGSLALLALGLLGVRRRR